jgi:hypothetical protein
MLTCTKCGKEVVGQRNWRAEKYYCSKQCMHSDKVDTECLWCKGKMQVRRYLLGTRRYCSASCRNKAYWERKKDRPLSLSVGEAAYIAAFIDGEGTISIRAYKRKTVAGGMRYNSVVEMNNTDVGVMQYLRSLIGPARYYIHKQPEGNGKRCYRFTVPSNVQRWLLETILPYLVIKKRQAEIVIEFLSLLGNKEYGKTDVNLGEREKLYQEAHNLNHRGTSQRRCTF